MKTSKPIDYLKAHWTPILIGLLLIALPDHQPDHAGNGSSIFTFNSAVTVALSISVAVHVLLVWREMPPGTHSRLIFSGLALGLVSWSIAEVWWGIAAILGSEAPYPSWADAFWILGYIPMYVAFWVRLRGLPDNTGSVQKLGLMILNMILGAWVLFFIIIPVLVEPSGSSLLENALNIIYPLADLALLIYVLRLFLTYQHGMYGRAWGWLAAGFCLNTFSDLIFTHASILNFYYPAGQANLISTLGVDFPYNSGYLCMLLGFLSLRKIQINFRPIQQPTPALPVLFNTHLFVSTLKDGLVFSVSDNYSQIFPVESVKGKTVAEVLGIPPEYEAALFLAAKVHSVFEEQTIQVSTLHGSQTAKVSGMALVSPQGEYTGINLLVRLCTEDNTLDDHLSSYQQGMINFLARQTHNHEEEEVKQFLARYYQSYFQAFYNRVFDEGGSILVDAFLTEMQSTAKAHGWQIEYSANALLNADNLPLATLKEALPNLVDAARYFVDRTIGQAAAASIMQEVASRFNERTIQTVSHYQMTKAPYQI
jgi:hypothetical protein